MEESGNGDFWRVDEGTSIQAESEDTLRTLNLRRQENCETEARLDRVGRPSFYLFTYKVKPDTREGERAPEEDLAFGVHCWCVTQELPVKT